MKVEWKKFSEEQPPEDQVIWVHHKSGTRYMIDPMSVDEEHTHWAFVDWPEPPEQPIKVRLKPVVIFKRNDFIGDMKAGGGHGWYATGSHGRLHYLSPDIFEEVAE